MKKNIILVILCIFAFTLSIFISSLLLNEGKTDLTQTMHDASLPVVYIKTPQGNINPMYGYTDEMQSQYIRNHITQINLTRFVELEIDTKNSEVSLVTYELRNLTGTRLIEKEEFDSFSVEDGNIDLSFQIKDLIEEEQEYALVVELTMKNGTTVDYYTRVVLTDQYYMDEKVSYVKDFSNKTFNKEEAADLTKYLESNYEGDNTTFGYVDIHSSFDQITWGEMQIERVSEPQVRVLELQEETASLELTYIVMESSESSPKYFYVTEYFRIRYTAERTYLLNYHRTMSEQFDFNETSFANDKCLLGITSEDVSLVESDDGENVAFVYHNQLFGVNPRDNKVTRIFSFYDAFTDDERNINNHNEIKILNCDEAGNLYFLVYGYHNRGNYEGKVGVEVYYYNRSLNTIEEKVFLAYNKSPEMLIYEVEKLTYLSNQGILYLIMNDDLIAVNIVDGQISILADSLMEGSFTVSKSNETIAWLEGDQLYNSSELVLMNLNTTQSYNILSTYGTSILPLDFMGEDLVYGEARNVDVIENGAGNLIFPMYRITIQDENGNVKKTYQEDGYYVIGCSIVDNQIQLSRVVWEEGEKDYISAEADQIVNSASVIEGKNTFETVTTAMYEKQFQIVLAESIDEEDLLFLTPKEVLYEGERNVSRNDGDLKEMFYVYVEGKIAYVSSTAGKAISYAQNNTGTVVNDYGQYVWYAGNRHNRNQIMAITEKQTTEDTNSLVICLDTILENEGIVRNTEAYVNQGYSVFEILEMQLPEAQILDLTGCELDSLLYYVNQDIPILAILDDGEAVLITGFNDLQVVVFDPSEGTLTKIGKKTASSWFERSGSVFFSYIERED